MKMLWEYIKCRRFYALLLLVLDGLFTLMLWLTQTDSSAPGYMLLLFTLLELAAAAVDLRHFARRHRDIQMQLNRIFAAADGLPDPDGLIEADYQELVRAVCADSARARSEADLKMQDMLDYYTLWAHQIKTPIAAMRLILQSDDAPNSAELEQELFRIEQYVEMVLNYLRLGSDSTDYVICRVELDRLLHQSVKKYAKQFIRRRIRLDYKETGLTVLTDEKWLSFAIEQLLANSLKYTREGGEIRIYAEGAALCIEDTGIGIAAEDLPRVFEKGYTGCNGRTDKKSTGIGLYLCRKILDKLGHGISIESEIGAGTKVKVYLGDE